jgi:CRP/FNR family cyclic AMP-dependent transcriptional regulator
MSIRRRNPDSDWLRELTLFRGCGDRELERVQQLTSIFDIPEGKVLCRQGQFGQETFFVISGEAEVAIDGTRIASLGPGSFFGEMSPLDGSRRVASVTAITQMKVLVSTSTELEMLLTDVPRVARRMLATVTGRLRLADRVLAARDARTAN